MRVIVIDDERLARKELIRMLKEYTHVDIIAEASNAEIGIQKIHELHPDLIFLDIQMPGMNGFEMLEELSFTPKVIFITAYDEFALKAFRVNAMDYLLKPIEDKQLEKAIENALLEVRPTDGITETNVSRKTLGSKDQIFLKDGDQCWFVQLSEVVKLESIGNYVRVYFHDEKPLILKSLNKLEERLDPHLFFRANRKYIINMAWIERIENMYNGGLKAILKEGSEVEISRRQSAKFKNTLSL